MIYSSLPQPLSLSSLTQFGSSLSSRAPFRFPAPPPPPSRPAASLSSLRLLLLQASRPADLDRQDELLLLRSVSVISPRSRFVLFQCLKLQDLFLSVDLVRQRQRAVEVYLPEEVQGEGEVGSSVASTAAGSAASTAPDIASLVEKALAKLPPEMAAEAKDPKRKAKSRDPGWQFGWWPDIAKKDSVQCIFCKTITPSGISRFKQHLAGGYGDAIMCFAVLICFVDHLIT